MKKTLIIGASSNPGRYSFAAAQRLTFAGHEIALIGKQKDTIFGKNIETEKTALEEIDTVTLYLSAKYQPEYYDYIVSLKPNRVIFNPGTENPDFENILDENGINWERACTLVLLASNQY